MRVRIGVRLVASLLLLSTTSCFGAIWLKDPIWESRKPEVDERALAASGERSRPLNVRVVATSLKSEYSTEHPDLVNDFSPLLTQELEQDLSDTDLPALTGPG